MLNHHSKFEIDVLNLIFYGLENIFVHYPICFGSTAVPGKILLVMNIAKNLWILKAAKRLNVQIMPAHSFNRHKKA